MAAKIFRINYKSDFILTLNSDAGWMTPFCIKFWTGAPSQAYFVGWDGTTYTNCAPVAGEPTKLLVQFDDHHLPIGDLKFQIAYHFTVADFPNDTEDEVINPASITTEIDGETYQVMLDFTGETAPEIEFSLPAYANEAQRIANEQQRISNEQTRIENEQTRIQHEETREANEAQRIRQEQGRVDAEDARTRQYAQDHQTAVNDHTRANEDHHRADEDHSRAESDHSTASDDHTTATNDHTRAGQDHQQATNDHTRAESDHSRAGEDHATATADHTRAGEDHQESVTQSAYAKDQGDYAKMEGDYAKDQGDYAKNEIDGAKGDFQSLDARFDHVDEISMYFEQTATPEDPQLVDEYDRVLRQAYQCIADLLAVKGQTESAAAAANQAAQQALIAIAQCLSARQQAITAANNATDKAALANIAAALATEKAALAEQKAGVDVALSTRNSGAADSLILYFHSVQAVYEGNAQKADFKNAGIKLPADATGEARLHYFHDKVFVQMEKTRAIIDHLETLVAADFWPFPTYVDLLFGV